TTMDPASESYYSTSPYAYCGNNPVNRIDPTGADWYEDKDGNLYWQEGHGELEGYTRLGTSVSIQLGKNSYLNAYQNAGIIANQAVSAFDLIAMSPKLQNQFLGDNSPLSETSKSELFNGLIGREMDAIARPIGEFLVWNGVGELAGPLIGKTVSWAWGQFAGLFAGKGYESFSAFKKAYGAAGQGMAWHHIVEQNADNIAKFGAEKIHNTKNLIKLPHGKGSIHANISGYYSSKQKFTNGLTVREWLKMQSYAEQYKFGISKLKEFGWKP
ncbi:RHS repeat-associated core domain-containing protein, partial [Bacteroides cellulosilyticus]